MGSLVQISGLPNRTKQCSNCSLYGAAGCDWIHCITFEGDVLGDWILCIIFEGDAFSDWICPVTGTLCFKWPGLVHFQLIWVLGGHADGKVLCRPS